MKLLHNKSVIVALILLALGAGAFLYFNKTQHTKQAEPSENIEKTRPSPDKTYKEFLSKDLIDFVEAKAGAVIKSDRGEKEITTAATLDEVKNLLEMLADKGISYDEVAAGDQPGDIIITGLRADGLEVAVLTLGKLNYAAATGLLAGAWDNSAPLFARMRAESVTIGAPEDLEEDGEAQTDQDNPMQIASIELGTVSLLLPEAATWKARSGKAGEQGREKDSEGEGAPLHDLRVQIANMLEALAIDGAIIENLQARIETEQNSYEIGEIRLGSVRAGSVKHLVLTDLKSWTRNSLSAVLTPLLKTANLPSFSSETPLVVLEGISVAGLLPYLQAGDMPLKGTENLVKFGEGYVSASRGYIDDTLYQETSARYDVPIEFVGLVPKEINLSSRPARFFIRPVFDAFYPSVEDVSGADHLAEIRNLIDKYFSLEGLDYSSALNWAYDTKADDGAFKISFASPQLADFAVAFDVAEIPLHEIAGTMLGLAGEKDREDIDLESLLTVTRLNGFELKMTDHRLLALIFDIVALSAPGTGGQIRASIPLLISLQASSLAEEAPQIEPIAQALRTFISNGGTLTVKSTPPSAMTIADLISNATNLGEVIDRAGLEVTHTE